jgi:predicted phosphodiesterase
MRIAALYDVHGNLPALEAVLADAAAEGVDELVVGGDVMWGPLQLECVELLRSEQPRWVAGNCERHVLNPTSDADRWCLEQLDAETRSFAATWESTIERDVPGVGRVVFCHATPTDDEAIVTTLTPDDAVRAAFATTSAEVVICGHTHVQFDRAVAGAPRLVNAGSVGLPYEGRPGACWALVDDGVHLRRTEYDVESSLERLEQAGFPRFADLFPDSLRGVTTAEEATERFESLRGA